MIVPGKDRAVIPGTKGRDEVVNSLRYVRKLWSDVSEWHQWEWNRTSKTSRVLTSEVLSTASSREQILHLTRVSYSCASVSSTVKVFPMEAFSIYVEHCLEGV